MADLIALLAGLAAGIALGAAVLGARRGSRTPLAVGRPAPAGPAPHRPPPSPGVDGGHAVHVNLPPSGPPPRAAAVAGAARSSQPRLELDDGSRTVPLGPDPVTIGRGKDQVLRIDDSRASRAHAVVRPRAKGGWEVVDAGSANGTTLNGHAIPEGRVAPLRDGDRIGIGPATIHYREGGGTDRPARSLGPEATEVLG